MPKFIVLLLLTFLPLSSLSAWSEDVMLSSVLKLKVYERESIGWNYVFSQWGSAVVLDSKRIVTNAHVIMDSKWVKPTGYYELCRFQKWKKDPSCFTTAKLLSYDSITDLALLELSSPISSAQKLTFSDKTLSIGSSTIVYGYPQIGGSNITRTEGKIWWTEWENYKFDGTIDHGNSWGWAFDQDGKLIGIPFAVRSDNGMIGYIIPTHILRDFLANKISSIEKYTPRETKEFVSYTRWLQALDKNPNLIKTKMVEIRDAMKSGFTLASSRESIDGKTIDYRFIDKNNRVAIVLICTRDASTRSSSLDIEKASFSLKYQNPSYSNTGKYIDKEQKFYLSESVSVKAVNGEYPTSALLYYSEAPLCVTYIVANDGTKKDKALYEKWIDFAKKIRFLIKNKVSTSFVSPFFNIEKIPEWTYISEGSAFSSTDRVPSMHITFDSDYTAYSRLSIEDYEAVDDYMNIWYYGDDNLYKSSDLSFEAFYNRYKTVGDSKIQDSLLISKNGKKMILSLVDKTNSWINPIQEKTRVIVFYPFKTQNWELKSYEWVFEYNTRNNQYIEKIRSLFEWIDLPGASPFR